MNKRRQDKIKVDLANHKEALFKLAEENYDLEIQIKELKQILDLETDCLGRECLQNTLSSSHNTQARRLQVEEEPEMKEEKVDEIMTEVEAEWKKRYGEEAIDPMRIEKVREALSMSPNENGIMPCYNTDTGKHHAVPMKDIILDGLKGSELDKYPVIEKENKVRTVYPGVKGAEAGDQQDVI